MSPNFLGEIMTSRHTTVQWPRYTQKGTRGDNRLNENVYRQLLTLLLIKNHYSEIIWDFGIRPVLNSPADNKGKRSENKTGANISLYLVVSLGVAIPHCLPDKVIAIHSKLCIQENDTVLKHTTALLHLNIIKATKNRLCYSTMSKILMFKNKIKPWHARKSTLISQSSLHQLHSITVPNHTARNNPGQNLSTVNQGACALY